MNLSTHSLSVLNLYNFIFGVSLNAVRLYAPFIYRVLYLKIKNLKRST